MTTPNAVEITRTSWRYQLLVFCRLGNTSDLPQTRLGFAVMLFVMPLMWLLIGSTPLALAYYGLAILGINIFGIALPAIKSQPAFTGWFCVIVGVGFLLTIVLTLTNQWWSLYWKRFNRKIVYV